MKTRRSTGPKPLRTLPPFIKVCAFLALFVITISSGDRIAVAASAEQNSDQVSDIAEITAIRVADHTRYQRVVIDTSAAVSFAIVEDKTPLTLLIDDATSTPQTLTWEDLGRLKGASIVKMGDQSVYISFDLTGPVRPRISSYTPDSYGGHRIVIDLWPINEPEPTNAAKTMLEPTIEMPVDTVNHQLAANQILGLTPEESWPDLGSTSEDATPELMEVPGLKVVQQWPDLLEEAAKTIKENESAPIVPPVAPSPNSERSPEQSGENNHTVTENVAGLGLMPAVDPITAARRSLAAGQPGEACKVLQLNYPKGTWNIEAMVLQGACLSALGKLVDANTLYTEVLSFEPANIDARLGLAKAQAEAGDLAAARDNYTRALGKMPAGDLRDTTAGQLQKVEDDIKHAIH